MTLLEKIRQLRKTLDSTQSVLIRHVQGAPITMWQETKAIMEVLKEMDDRLEGELKCPFCEGPRYTCGCPNQEEA